MSPASENGRSISPTGNSSTSGSLKNGEAIHSASKTVPLYTPAGGVLPHSPIWETIVPQPALIKSRATHAGRKNILIDEVCIAAQPQESCRAMPLVSSASPLQMKTLSRDSRGGRAQTLAVKNPIRSILSKTPHPSHLLSPVNVPAYKYGRRICFVFRCWPAVSRRQSN